MLLTDDGFWQTQPRTDGFNEARTQTLRTFVQKTKNRKAFSKFPMCSTLNRRQMLCRTRP